MMRWAPRRPFPTAALGPFDVGHVVLRKSSRSRAAARWFSWPHVVGRLHRRVAGLALSAVSVKLPWLNSVRLK